MLRAYWTDMMKDLILSVVFVRARIILNLSEHLFKNTLYENKQICFMYCNIKIGCNKQYYLELFSGLVGVGRYVPSVRMDIPMIHQRNIHS